MTAGACSLPGCTLAGAGVVSPHAPREESPAGCPPEPQFLVWLLAIMIHPTPAVLVESMRQGTAEVRYVRPRSIGGPGKLYARACVCVCVCVCVCPALCDPIDGLLCPWAFPGKPIGVGCQNGVSPFPSLLERLCSLGPTAWVHSSSESDTINPAISPGEAAFSCRSPPWGPGGIRVPEIRLGGMFAKMLRGHEVSKTTAEREPWPPQGERASVSLWPSGTRSGGAG